MMDAVQLYHELMGRLAGRPDLLYPAWRQFFDRGVVSDVIARHHSALAKFEQELASDPRQVETSEGQNDGR